MNRRLARDLFGGAEGAVGRTVSVDVSSPPLTAAIIGVVSDVRHTSPWHEPMPEVFFSVWQVPLPSLTLVVEPAEVSPGPPATWRQTLRTVEPSMAVPAFASWDFAARSRVRPYERRVVFSGLLAGTAMLLVIVSVWALTNRSLAARRRELALRLALGCSPRRTWAGLVAESGFVTFRGALVGGLLAWPAVKTTWASVGVSEPSDGGLVWSVAAVVAFVTATAILAAASPARAAAALDPARELRS